MTKFLKIPDIPAATVKKAIFLVDEMFELWFNEAIFGSGFFHGDLHGGNVIIQLESVELESDLKTVLTSSNGQKDLFEKVLGVILKYPQIPQPEHIVDFFRCFILIEHQLKALHAKHHSCSGRNESFPLPFDLARELVMKKYKTRCLAELSFAFIETFMDRIVGWTKNVLEFGGFKIDL
jgi:hypothetical protein